MVEELAVNSVSTLAEAVGIVSGSLIVEPTDSNTDEFFDRLHSDDVDFSDVRLTRFSAPLERSQVIHRQGARGREHVCMGACGLGRCSYGRVVRDQF